LYGELRDERNDNVLNGEILSVFSFELLASLLLERMWFLGQLILISVEEENAGPCGRRCVTSLTAQEMH
jgi:hypothetical protein